MKDEQPHPGQTVFYRALAYGLKLLGKGRVAGEIIAGLENPQRSIEAIEFLAAQGAVSTVCVFRPCIGTRFETTAPPDPDELRPVFARMYEVCVEYGLPIGLAPNIKTAMVHLQEEGRWLSSRPIGLRERLYHMRLALQKTAFKGLFSLSRIGKK